MDSVRMNGDTDEYWCSWYREYRKKSKAKDRCCSRFEHKEKMKRHCCLFCNKRDDEWWCFRIQRKVGPMEGQLCGFFEDNEMSATPTVPGEDVVNHPSHYTKGGIETLDFIEAWGFNYPEGNVIKYLCRYKYKGKPLEDLKKCRVYLDRLITAEEKKIEKEKV